PRRPCRPVALCSQALIHGRGVRGWPRRDGARSPRTPHTDAMAPAERREPHDRIGRLRGMPLRRARHASRATLVLLVAGVLAACSGGSSAGPSSPPASPLTEAAAKIALMSRFGPLVYCDPDFYPIAREDESEAAKGHVKDMQGDNVVWAAIAA